MFSDGVLMVSTACTAEPGNYTSSIFIGANATPTGFMLGYLDEFRVSKAARWTSNFTPPSIPYGNTYASEVYIGAMMPLSGINLYVDDSKSGKSIDIAANEWNGSSWVALAPSPSTQTLADGTEYEIRWANTAATSKIREVEKVVQYWYKLVLSNATDFNGVTISQCKTKIPFQQVRDFWSGEPRPLAAFLVNKSGNFNDYTANVSDDTFDAANQGTWALLDSLTSSDYVVVGSTERLMGIVVNLAGANINTSATTLSVSYYNGTSSPDNASSWTALAGVVDGTLNGTKTLNKSGFITWNNPTLGSEFKSAGWTSKIVTPLLTGNSWKTNLINAGIKDANKKSVAESQQGITYPLYYYKITFTGAEMSDMAIYYAYGIPAQREIRGYRFPVMHQDRLWLCGDTQKDKNYVICSAYQSPTVLGFGEDNAEFWIGDDTELVAGCSLFTRYGSTVADILVLCKQHETYVIDGDGPSTYKVRRVSEHIGCIAPLTLVSVPMGDDAIPGTPRNIAIWLSQQGVMAFDGSNFVLISADIYDKFEPTNANYIGAAITTCTAYYDSTYGEYHLLVPGSAEYVYHVGLKKWYTVDRGSFKLRCGLTVYDTNGLAYTYGSAATKLYRLENGSTMAGDAFTRTLRTGDVALPEGSIMEYARVNWLMLIGKAMTNPVSASYYTDSSTTDAKDTTIIATNSGKRLMNKVAHNKGTQATFHGFNFEATDMFEPLYLAFRYTIYPRELS